MLMPAPISSWISMHTDLIFIGIGISSGIFAITLLNARTTAQKSLPYIKYCVFIYVLLAACCLIGLFPQVWQNILVSLLSVVAVTSYAYAGFESYSNRFYPAKYYIIAWCLLVSCGLTAALSIFGLVHENFFTTYCFQMGLFIQACLFSVALMESL